jgi:hypothetical protein
MLMMFIMQCYIYLDIQYMQGCRLLLLMMLHARPSPSFKGKSQGEETCSQEHRSGDVDDRCALVKIGVHGNDRSENSHDPVGGGDQSVSGSPMHGGEGLRGLSVEDGVHDVAGKVVSAVPSEKCFGAGCGGRGEEEDTGQDGRDTETSLSPESLQFDKTCSH